MSNLLMNWFSYTQRDLIAIALSTSMVGGYMLGWGLSGKLVVEYGWQVAFWTPGVIIVLFAVVWFLLSKNHPKEIGLRSPNRYQDVEGSHISQKLSLL